MSLDASTGRSDRPVRHVAGAAARATGPADAETPHRPGRYLPAVDGIRAVAVAAVVAYHLGRLRGGFIGVDLFFVISGFLITRNLLAERARTGRVSLVSFWRRRFRRLVPPLLVVLAATAVGSRIWLDAWRLGELRTDALAALGYVANWRFVAGGESYFSPDASPLRHTWSLAVEEQFYIVWPLLVLGAMALGRGRRGQAVAVVAATVTVVSAAWMVVVAGWGDPSRVYYGTDTRVFALTAGALAAVVVRPRAAAGPVADERGRRAAWAAMAALALLVPFAVWGSADGEAFSRGGFQAVAALSVVVVVGLAQGGGRPVAVLGHPVPVWIGRRSYGIYLWSWPVQILLGAATGLAGWAFDVTVVALTVALAALSYAVVERPFLRAGRPRPSGAAPGDERPSRQGRLLAGAVAATAVVVVASAVGAPAPPAHTTLTDDEAVAAALAPEPTAAGGGDLHGTGGPDPAVPRPFDTPFDPDAPLVVGPDDVAAPGIGPLHVLLAGDSTAWTLAFDLEASVREQVRISNRAMIGCGILPPDARPIVGDEVRDYPDGCAEQEHAEQIGLEGGPDVAVLWIGAWEVFDQEHRGTIHDVGSASYTQLLEELLQGRVDRYRAAGVPTVITLVPCFGTQHPAVGDERNEPWRQAWVNDRVRTVAEANRGWVRLVDPAEVLCHPDGTVRTHAEDGTELRYDGAHYRRESASWMWSEWLVPRLESAFPGGG